MDTDRDAKERGLLEKVETIEDLFVRREKLLGRRLYEIAARKAAKRYHFLEKDTGLADFEKDPERDKISQIFEVYAQAETMIAKFNLSDDELLVFYRCLHARVIENWTRLDFNTLYASKAGKAATAANSPQVAMAAQETSTPGQLK